MHPVINRCHSYALLTDKLAHSLMAQVQLSLTSHFYIQLYLFEEKQQGAEGAEGTEGAEGAEGAGDSHMLSGPLKEINRSRILVSIRVFIFSVVKVSF